MTYLKKTGYVSSMYVENLDFINWKLSYLKIIEICKRYQVFGKITDFQRPSLIIACSALQDY